ncbi:KilA-N domain-containing protein [Haliscomenobacter hydrossis]|uniref:KilA, /APSES-type HTH DNA-binding domain protein n=1 Tax=Haliscomenobacter hydrossis (strain ATCC 27775 / DSM 1100 / LMG 10767 / O) TaxID=760192 RepID=F4L7L7_HALH1|nr:KilA-N domain-containing protein [Haliscomenobacter hydrossis]AEE54375.1 KilA, /APSES-type HTH DNA-binding domain protein [Haliscomenobacter hydrossis DSM 1100]
MSGVTKFDYGGQTISFEFADGNKMINATEMARPFRKQIGHFLALQGTRDYILLLESRYRDSDIGGMAREVLRVIKGGVPELQGTWMDEKLALKFAAWLSPEFELWVYDRIQELITTGVTRLQGIPPSGFAATLRLLAEQWEKQEHINENVREELDKTAQRLDELESKIISVDDHYYTIAGYCNLHKIPCPLHQAKEWGKTAAALSRQKDIPTGAAHDERYGQVRTYHEDVLKEVIG